MEKKVYFTNSDGVRLCGILTNPSNSKARPIVILVHGFHSNKDRDTYTTIARRLAKENISSLRFDLYGHGESKGKFEDITLSEAIDDVCKAIEYIKKKGYRRIGLFGNSFGGSASLFAASQSQDLLFLVVMSTPSYPYMKELGSRSKREIEKWEKNGFIYYESSNKEKLRLNYKYLEDLKDKNGYEVAHKVKIPTLIIHGDKDEKVPYKQSVKLSKVISNCIFHTVKGANHRYEDPKHREEMSQKIVEFIVENV